MTFVQPYNLQIKGVLKQLLIIKASVYLPRTITVVKTSQLFPDENISQCQEILCTHSYIPYRELQGGGLFDQKY